MKNLYHIAQQISRGEDLDKNFKLYSTGMSSMYNSLAYIKLSMNYYTVYDMLREKEYDNDAFMNMYEEFNSIISDDVLAYDGSEAAERIEAIRNKIISIMEVVTEYVDRLRIYEYVLNRIEHKFGVEEPDEEYYGTFMTNDIMHYILSDRDNVVINSKIAEITGQIPMRLTKEKFYDYIRDAFTLYHGAQKQTIDDFAYALRTSAMIGEAEGFNSMFPDVYDIYCTLKDADYAHADKAEYDRLSGALKIAADKMTECADMFVLLAQMVNDAYTIIITSEESLDHVEEVETAHAIINEVWMCCNDNNRELDDKVVERFTLFEGIQERILENISKTDYVIDMAVTGYMDKLENLQIKRVYEALSKVTKLQSGSDFVDLSADAELMDIPEDSYADDVCETLVGQLADSFVGIPTIVRRAVMSSVISQLPVFFNNTDEIQQYINMSLQQCSDKAEKMAVIEVIKMIIQG